MREHIKLIRSLKVYIVVMTSFFIAFAMLELINKRFWLHDFQVYYDAASNYFSGGQVYGIPFGLGSGYYKYSPFALFLFFPLTLFPYGMAKVIYFILLSLLILFTVILSERIVRTRLFGEQTTKPTLLVLFLITLSFMQHIYFELHLGNINILLLFLVLIVLLLILMKKELPAGTILAISILIKPHFIILLPLMLIRKRLIVVMSCVFAVALGLLIPSIYTGFEVNMNLLGQWRETILIHNSSPVTGQDTIYSWLYRMTGSTITESGLKIFVPAVLLFMAILVAVFYFYNKRCEREKSGRKESEEQNFLFESFVLVALIPNLTVTDSEHFLFSVPLLAWMINYIFLGRAGYLINSMIIFILILYGGNLREVIGAPASKWMTATGILGLGNLFLIGMSIYLWLFRPVKTLPASA